MSLAAGTQHGLCRLKDGADLGTEYLPPRSATRRALCLPRAVVFIFIGDGKISIAPRVKNSTHMSAGYAISCWDTPGR